MPCWIACLLSSYFFPLPPPFPVFIFLLLHFLYSLPCLPFLLLFPFPYRWWLVIAGNGLAGKYKAKVDHLIWSLLSETMCADLTGLHQWDSNIITEVTGSISDLLLQLASMDKADDTTTVCRSVFVCGEWVYSCVCVCVLWVYSLYLCMCRDIVMSKWMCWVYKRVYVCVYSCVCVWVDVG